MRNICLDIGNSKTKIAIFKQKELIFTTNFIGLESKSLARLIKKHDVQNAIVSSTKKKFAKVWKKTLKGKHFELSHTLPIPIKNQYSTPETLGQDRIAAAVGASMRFKNKNCLIIDAGTCITLDILENKNGFVGGNISPGIRMRIKAMHAFTSKLPLVSFDLPAGTIGKTTEEALQNGAIRGTIGEIESFIKAIRRHYKRINIILTGGDAIFLADHLKKKIFVSPNLVLKGLNEILLYNLAKS